MKTIKRIILPQPRKTMLGRTPSLHPVLNLAQGFDEMGQRLWYSQIVTGNTTESHTFPVQWDISSLNVNLADTWQVAQGVITLPEGMQIDPSLKIILLFYFTAVVNVEVPPPPANLLNIPVNINTATKQELMTLPLSGAARFQSGIADAIIAGRNYNSVDELETKGIVRRVPLLNCKLVGVSVADAIVEKDELVIDQVIEALQDFEARLETIDEIPGIGPKRKLEIIEHFNK